MGIQLGNIGIYINLSMKILEKKVGLTNMSSALHRDMCVSKLPRIGVEAAQLTS